MAQHLLRAALLAAAALALGACSLLRPAQPALPRQRPVIVSQLSNGMTLAVQHDASIALATMDMWVRVGAGDEPAELAGVSHFLEHMLFKGTPKFAAGEYDRRIEEIGGYLNAATSQDYTHYYVTVPSEHFERAIADFAEVMSNSSIDPHEVESERQVILEEIRRKNDSPFGYLFDTGMPELYEAGPYRHTVLGSSESVSAITRDQLAEHYHRHYAPANMFLNIVGNVDPTAAKAAAEKCFGPLARPFRPWRDAAPETRFAAPQAKALPHEWNEAYFFFAFPAPPPRKGAPPAEQLREMAVSDLAETLLAGSRAARLKKSLQEEQRLVSSIDTWFPNSRHPGHAFVYGTCERGRVPAVRAALFAELEKLAAGGIGGAEFARIRRQALNGHLFATETNAGRASTLGYSLTMLGRPDMLTKYADAVSAVEPADVQQWVRDTLRESRAAQWSTERP